MENQAVSSERPYQFEVDEKEKEHVLWSLYIHWICDDGKNELVGRVSLLVSFKGKRFMIEYFEDCLEKLIPLGFDRISGCSPDRGDRVWEYPYSYLPVFIEERMLHPRRPDLGDRLEELGLEIYDRYEFLKRTHGVCSDNFLFVSDKEDEKDYWHEFKHGYCLGVPKPQKEE